MTKKTYNVYLYERPHKYRVKAENKEQAERLAIKIHNGGDDMAIYKSEVLRLIYPK